jgi:hypothetical protein
MKTSKKLLLAAAVAVGALTLTGCSTQATTVSDGLSKDADSFKIERRITFINGITDKYILVIEGKCSQNNVGSQLEVVCKTGDGEYKKHFLGLSDNVTYMSEQIEGAEADPYHYKVIFKPEEIIPNIDLQTSNDPENLDK